MIKQAEVLTTEKILSSHHTRRDEIRRRLSEFENIWLKGSDADLWEEMVYCFFTGGCSAKMGIRSVNAIRHLLADGTQPEIAGSLTGVHRYPNARSKYVVASREFLQKDCGMRLRDRLSAFKDDIARRDWLVREKGIKGLGYKEASHYLRNIGLFGYAILDKHVLNCMAELGLIEDPKPPSTRDKYLRAEQKLKGFAAETGIDFDELDLVLWSMKTGEILK